MENLSLLIIEDEESQIQIYSDAIDQFNKKNPITIDKKICRSLEEGEVALLSPFYDAAIIDLKLSNTQDLEGLDLIESVNEKIRIPIFIVSGGISQIDQIKENALLRKRLRTDRMSVILDEIYSIYKTGITNLLRPNGIIDKKLSEIFWKNLSTDIEFWIAHNNQKSLLRYIMTHFQEYLDINVDGDFEAYQPMEVYLSPPIKKNLHTGDLIKIETEFYLILNPACDIVFNYKDDGKGNKKASRKADKMVLVRVKEFDLNDFCLDKNNNLNKGKVKEYVENGSYRYHYLPPFKNETGYLIDFQELCSVTFATDHTKIASISAPFIKDIISRFSSYYSRQGQPTFKQDTIINDIYDKASQKNN